MTQKIEKMTTNLEQAQFVQNGPLKVWQLLETPDRSVALILLNGENHQVKNTDFEATYEVKSGIGIFTLWDGDCPEARVVRAGDCVRIPAGALYKDVGAHLLMVCECKPAFDPKKVVVLD